MSTRSNGGIIGPQNRTTSAYANGVWHLYDNQQSVLAKNWPGFVPVAPSPPAVGTVTLGSGTLNALLTATIPFTQGYNGGNAITKVTAISIPGGLTANTNGSSPITISGLSSNTNYVFGLFETNYYGDSPYGYSNPVQTASVPSAPTIGTATAIDSTSANVTFTASSSNGGTPITGYTATSTPGNVTGTSATSPITISGLNASTNYTFTVYATNLVGNSAVSNASNQITTPAVQPTYLVVGGGGGSNGGANGGGGGGAGGLLTADFTITTGVTYSITVGGGSTGLAFATVSNGSNSQLSGTGLTTVTALGGGGGAIFANGQSGGSGSGGPASSTGFSGGAGTAGQGKNGGSNQSGPPYMAGGGGGAGAVGGNGSVGGQSGAGGIGLQSSITGTATYYAGGGGGGGTVQGATPNVGGLGGGGDGGTGNNSTPPTNGAAYTGGGGGGGGNGSNSYVGGNGGSGVVIISSGLTAVSTTGSPTVTTVGGKVIYKFTGNGSITY